MGITPDMEIAAVAIALVAYAAYREWLRHQRRTLIHQERLAAIEKGAALPPLEQEQVDLMELLLEHLDQIRGQRGTG